MTLETWADLVALGARELANVSISELGELEQGEILALLAAVGRLNKAIKDKLGSTGKP